MTDFLWDDLVFKGEPMPMITLYVADEPVGKLEIGDKGKLTFEGDVEKSAKVFFDNVVALNSEHIKSQAAVMAQCKEALSELVEALKILGSDTYILSEKTRISIAKSALSNYQKYMESELCQ